MSAVVLRGNRVLLVERGHEPLKGYWSLPGGVVEVGEGLEDAVRREVREETGLLVAPASIVVVFERILRDSSGKPEYHYVLIDYLCRVTGGELEAADDAIRCAWVTRKELSRYRLTEGAEDVIAKAFQIRKDLRDR